MLVNQYLWDETGRGFAERRAAARVLLGRMIGEREAGGMVLAIASGCMGTVPLTPSRRFLLSFRAAAG